MLSRDRDAKRGTGEVTLRVCMIAPLPPPYGGISHWTAAVCEHGRSRRDIQLQVINTSPRWRAVHDLRPVRRILGGTLQCVRDIGRVFWQFLVRRPGVVHLTTSGQFAVYRDLVALVLARVFGIAVVYHLRFGWLPEIAAHDTREWRRLSQAMRYATIVIPIDEATESAIRNQLPQVRLRRLPNFVDTRALLPTDGGRRGVRTVAFVGWVVATKGIEELVKAWAALQPEGWRLRIVGPGDENFRQLLLTKHCPQDIEFLGELPHAEAMKIIGDAEVFVLPSYTEGFPNVILEAMALGKAIVATRVGAIPEMLDDGCGILVAKENTRELASALAQLLDDETLRSTLGSRSRERVQARYSVDTVFEQLVDVWRQASVRTA